MVVGKNENDIWCYVIFFCKLYQMYKAWWQSLHVNINVLIFTKYKWRNWSWKIFVLLDWFFFSLDWFFFFLSSIGLIFFMFSVLIRSEWWKLWGVIAVANLCQPFGPYFREASRPRDCDGLAAGQGWEKCNFLLSW